MQIARRLFLAGAAASATIPSTSLAQAAEERWTSHWDARQAIISARAIASGTGGIALIGDSLTETIWWPELGGTRVVNLGFGAARTRNLLKYVPAAIDASKPDAAIIMASINNSIGGLAADEHAAYPEELRQLVRAVKASVPAVSLITITPVEGGKLLSTIYENDRVVKMNGVIRGVAEAEDVKVHDAYEPISQISDSTFDGVHLTSKPYEVLKAIYEHAAERI